MHTSSSLVYATHCFPPPTVTNLHLHAARPTSATHQLPPTYSPEHTKPFASTVQPLCCLCLLCLLSVLSRDRIFFPQPSLRSNLQNTQKRNAPRCTLPSPAITLSILLFLDTLVHPLARVVSFMTTKNIIACYPLLYTTTTTHLYYSSTTVNAAKCILLDFYITCAKPSRE